MTSAGETFARFVSTRRVRHKGEGLAAAAVAALVSSVAGAPAPATAGHDEIVPIREIGPIRQILPGDTVVAPGHGVSTPALGVVLIEHKLGQNPTFTPTGALANPALWSCSHNLGTGVLVGPYVVTCVTVPNTFGFGWHCPLPPRRHPRAERVGAGTHLARLQR